MNTGYPEIPIFDVEAHFDLTGTPKLLLSNLSTGTQLGCLFAFDLTSPLGEVIHSSNFSPADIVAPWITPFTIPESLPLVFGSFEFGVYTLISKVKVGAAAPISFTQKIEILAPKYNKGNNPYGVGSLNMSVQCNSGKIVANDISDYFYNGSLGKVIEKKITLAPPPDNSAVTPAPVVVKGFSSVNFNIPYNAKGFVLMLDTIVEYKISANNYVKLLYRARKSFDVLCNIDLSVVMNEVYGLQRKLRCEPTVEGFEKLTLIQGMLIQAIIGKMQPQSGIDVQALLADIIDIGNFDCKCLIDPTGGIGVETIDDQYCKFMAALASKASASGLYVIQVNKDAASDCNKISLVSTLPGITGIIGSFGTTTPASTTVPATTIPQTTVPPATTIPQTTVPATTLPATTVPATTTGLVSFNSNIVFPSSTTVNSGTKGVGGFVPTANPNSKVEFNLISPLLSSFPATMNVFVNNQFRMTIDFIQDYLGQPFRYTDVNGTVYYSAATKFQQTDLYL